MGSVMQRHFRIKESTRGFTIVELIVASAVFSLMLLTTAAIIIQIGRLYYKGTVLTKTQSATAAILDTISQPIQLENTTVVDGNARTIGSAPNLKTIDSVCIGTTRITYAVGLSIGPNNPGAGTIPHPVWRDTVAAPQVCADSANDVQIENAGLTGGSDMLTEDMRLTNIRVEPVDTSVNPNGEGIWFVEVGVLFGENDVINTTDPDTRNWSCNGAVAGSQWCARSELQTRVLKRINDANNN